jgi:hypothetical protein
MVVLNLRSERNCCILELTPLWKVKTRESTPQERTLKSGLSRKGRGRRMARATARVSQIEQPRPTLPRNIVPFKALPPAPVASTSTPTCLPAPRKTIATSKFSPLPRNDAVAPTTLADTTSRRTCFYRRRQQCRRQYRKTTRRRQTRRRTCATAASPRPAPPTVCHDARCPLPSQPVHGP